MTDPTPLSPQAQAVLDVAGRHYAVDGDLQDSVAAALRAAADQVVPEPSDQDKEMFSIAALRLRWVIRDQLLAIAAELDGTNAACRSEGGTADEIHLRGLRAVLARWGNHRGILGSSPQPVPVSERLPGPNDCDAEGRCWWWDNVEGGWYLRKPSSPVVLCPADLLQMWLPFNALPLPSGEVES